VTLDLRPEVTPALVAVASAYAILKNVPENDFYKLFSATETDAETQERNRR